MRYLMVIVVALACGSVSAETQQEKMFKQMTDRQEMLEKVRKFTTSHGAIPVKYHEMFGPYKLWVVVGINGFGDFEARFVGIKNGHYLFGIDDVATKKTNIKRMQIFSLPMKRFHYQVQQELSREVQARAKAAKEKRELYPEPPPEVATVEPVAKVPEKKEAARWGGSYRRVNGKLVPVEIPLNQAAADEVKRELEKNAPKKP